MFLTRRRIFSVAQRSPALPPASTRTPRHVIDGALAGAHVATIPFKVMAQMVKHPLTDKGIAQFEADWAKAQEELAAKA